jgi:hypothetical protein
MPVRYPERHPYSLPGRIAPLGDRLSPHEHKRRQIIREFTQKNENPRFFATVMKYVRRLVDDFDVIYTDTDTPLFEAWHALRVEMLGLPLNTPDYHKISQAMVDKFDAKFFKNPKTGEFDDNKFVRVKPALMEITYLVTKNNVPA